MATYFVDASGGNDANDGLDNSGVGLSTANWTAATRTLTETSHGYTFSTGDLIYISGGTSATVGLYEVESSTANTVVLVETTTLPGVNDAATLNAGDLSNSDITSASGPEATLGAVTTASGDRVWVRGGTDYGETLTIGVAGADAANAIEWVGYTTTIGDGGRFVIDGGSSRTDGIDDSISGNGYLVFKNMEIKDTTTRAVDMPALNNVVFSNCYFHDTVGGVGSMGDNVILDRCIFEDITSGAAFEGDSTCVAVACTFKNCSGTQCFRAEGGSVVGCLFFDVGTNCNAIELFFADAGVIAFNTIYGATGGTCKGIFVNSGTIDNCVICNNIIANCAEGIDRTTDDWSPKFWCPIFNNVLYNNTDAYSNMPEGENDLTSDPQFNDVSSDDYRIASGSPAVGAGYTAFDNATSPNQDSNVTIGAFQIAPGGGAGVAGIISGSIM